MLCGCCICFGAAIALGVDGRWVQPQHFPGLCAARAWLLATGFSMAYGAMFTKVWRVHRHTTKPKPETKVMDENFLFSKINVNIEKNRKRNPEKKVFTQKDIYVLNRRLLNCCYL